MPSFVAICFLVASSLACLTSSLRLAPTSQLQDPFQTLIIGGQKANITTIPWQAAIRNRRSSGAICGGSIIGTRWVLTAASCLVDEKTGRISDRSRLVVVVGAANLKDITSVHVPVRQVIVHPKYQ